MVSVLYRHPCHLVCCYTTCFNWLMSEQNGCHFADNNFKFIFLKEKFHILIGISPKLTLEDLVNIGSGHGLALETLEADISTSINQVLWCHMVSLGLDKLLEWPFKRWCGCNFKSEIFKHLSVIDSFSAFLVVLSSSKWQKRALPLR